MLTVGISAVLATTGLSVGLVTSAVPASANAYEETFTSNQVYTVDPGVTGLRVILTSAAGSDMTNANGGNGATISFIIPNVSTGNQFQILVNDNNWNPDQTCNSGIDNGKSRRSGSPAAIIAVTNPTQRAVAGGGGSAGCQDSFSYVGGSGGDAGIPSTASDTATAGADGGSPSPNPDGVTGGRGTADGLGAGGDSAPSAEGEDAYADAIEGQGVCVGGTGGNSGGRGGTGGSSAVVGTGNVGESGCGGGGGGGYGPADNVVGGAGGAGGASMISASFTRLEAVANSGKTASVVITELTDDDNLSGLSIGQGTLVPAFDAATTSYTASVGNGVTSFPVTATTDDPNATVTVSPANPAPLNVGPNTITITVTSSDGSETKQYTIVVTRAASTDADLSDLVVTPATLSPAFASSTLNYEADVDSSVESVTVTPTVSESNSTVTVNGTTVTSGETSGDIDLDVGLNTINVTVTAEDGVTSQTYTVTIQRGPGPPSSFTFVFRLPDGRDCTAIPARTVIDGTVVSLPGSDADCRTMPGATVGGWTIPTPPDFTGIGSNSLPFAPGAKVRVSGDQQFTVVPFEPVIELVFDSNVGAGAVCAPNDVVHTDADNRLRYVWVPRELVLLARVPVQAACSPEGYMLAEWNTEPDGSGTAFNPGSGIPEMWGTASANTYRFYAIWHLA